jgi:ankyrin repeat protein
MKAKKIFSWVLVFVLLIIIGKLVGRYYGSWVGSRVISQKVENRVASTKFPKSIDDALEKEDPVLMVSARGTPEDIKTNIDSSKINYVNACGYTPLLIAAMMNPDPNAIDLLIKMGADKEARTETSEDALIVAARWNESAAVVQKLIDAGFKVNSRTTQNGKTALMYAANYNKNPDILRLLIKNGADVHLKSLEGLYKGDTALMFSCRFFAGGNVEKARILIEAGSNLNERNALGETPLIVATQSETRNVGIIRLLLSKGADPKLKDDKGKMAIDYADLDATLQAFKEFGIERR